MLVVLGEGMAAGVGHFGLSAEVQEGSFPSLWARQLGTPLEQPLMEPPGIGHVAGQSPVPVIVPDLLQTTVRRDFPPTAASLGNLSVPGLTLAQALDLRPSLPLVHRDNPLQTAVNLILGVPHLLQGGAPEAAPTAVEYAVARQPTAALVALGYQEAVTAALAGDAAALPLASAFRHDLERLLAAFGEEDCGVVLATIPDPLDTAYFTTVDAAARLLRTTPAFLMRHFGLEETDLVGQGAALEMGHQLLAHDVQGGLPEGSTLSADAAAALRAGVEALNREIADAAESSGGVLWDLHRFIRRFAADGAKVGDRHLDAEPLGGFYLLNGFYPGATGHALLANDLIQTLGKTFGKKPRAVGLAAIAKDDPNLMARRSEGPSFEDEFLHPWGPDLLPPPPEIDPSTLEFFPIQTTYPGTPFDFGGMKAAAKCVPMAGMPAGGVAWRGDALELPEGLEQTLPLFADGSYFGDALRMVDAPEDQPFIPGLPAFGASGKTFFGGLLLTDSRLHGQVHIRFGEPDGDRVTRFEITHPGGLMGENGTLAAPQYFRLPSYLNMVSDVPGLISSGNLDLKTGLVTNLHYNVLFLNTAILSLFAVNPHLPKMPMAFPGPPNAGSTSARFETRADGNLDVTLAANMFLPLGHEHGGEPVRLPLPFGSPMLECATIPARGLSLHPHIHWTTREDPLRDDGFGSADADPGLEENTVYELVTFNRNSSFGDVFGLDIEELGGSGTGRSHLMGRLRLQTGPKFGGGKVPVAMSFLPPGGQLDGSPQPLPYLPPGTSRGLIGFNEQLKFPKLTYDQSGLSSADDPNNRAVGAVDLSTGRVVGEMLHRAFVVQELFVHLIRLEPCTPADSFNYQGPAAVERGGGGELIYRFDGEVYLPYPKGFHFPAPGGEKGLLVVGPSQLDPFLRLRAHSGMAGPQGMLAGGQDLVSSIGRSFSYRYSLTPGGPASFEYTDLEQGATFVLTALSWVAFSRSRPQPGTGAAPDTVTLTGFGTWSGDAEGGLHVVAAQICSGPEPYVGIQVDGGLTSNVNTKPEHIEDTMP
ncbi:MAG: hypothetical protein AAGD06_13395 [Acidobacteriota bacterium]